MIVAVLLLAAPADYSLTGAAALTLEAFAVPLLAVIVWRSKWDLRSEQGKTFVRTSANAPVLLFLGWVTLSAALSPQKAFSLQYLLQVGAGVLLYFAVGYHFRQSKHLSMLADVLLFLALVVSFGGLAQYQLHDQDRASALFGNPQPLGSLIMLLLPVVAALAIGDKNSRRQTVAQIALALMVGCLLLTHGRSAWAGGVAGILALSLLSLPLTENSERNSSVPLSARKHQLVLPGVLAVIALGFVFAMNSQNASVAGRAGTLSQLGVDNSWQHRVQTHWQGTAEMISQRPFTGLGRGSVPLLPEPFHAVRCGEPRRWPGYAHLAG
jgi:hypothetical protein